MNPVKQGAAAEWGDAAMAVITERNILRWIISSFLYVVIELCQKKLGLIFEKLGEVVLLLISYLLLDTVWTYVTRRYSHWKKRSAVE